MTNVLAYNTVPLITSVKVFIEQCQCKSQSVFWNQENNNAVNFLTFIAAVNCKLQLLKLGMNADTVNYNYKLS